MLLPAPPVEADREGTVLVSADVVAADVSVVSDSFGPADSEEAWEGFSLSVKGRGEV